MNRKGHFLPMYCSGASKKRIQLTRIEHNQFLCTWRWRGLLMASHGPMPEIGNSCISAQMNKELSGDAHQRSKRYGIAGGCYSYENLSPVPSMFCLPILCDG